VVLVSVVSDGCGVLDLGDVTVSVLSCVLALLQVEVDELVVLDVALRSLGLLQAVVVRLGLVICEVGDVDTLDGDGTFFVGLPRGLTLNGLCSGVLSLLPSLAVGLALDELELCTFQLLLIVAVLLDDLQVAPVGVNLVGRGTSLQRRARRCADSGPVASTRE
jgi:hypothetical protein